MDNLTFRTIVELTIGKRGIATLIAGQNIIAQQNNVTLSVTMDAEVRELLNERVQRDDLPTGGTGDTPTAPPSAPEAESDGQAEPAGPEALPP